MWLNPFMLSGLMVLAIPVAIHLLLRPRPRQMKFPALRFVRESVRASSGMLRLKQLLLLLLRMAVLALFVLVLARPLSREHVIAAAGGAERLPAAVVFCFDNSASMSYREFGYSRLEVAKQLAQRIAAGLSPPLRAAVIDLSTAAQVRSLEAGSTGASGLAERLDRVPESFLSRSVAGLLRPAEVLLAQADEERREIYLFTDLTETAWHDVADGAFAEFGGVPVYVLDVGVRENLNLALEEPRLSSRFAARNETVSIAAELVAGDRPARCAVGLEIEGELRGRAAVELKQPREIHPVSFEETMGDPGILQGRLCLLESDALAADNTRYFTIQVGRAPPVAVVRSDVPAQYGPVGTGELSDTAWLVATALAPESLRARGTAAVEPLILSAAQLGARPLGGFEAVFLADAAGISPAGWAALERFAADGGGLIVIAGPNVARELAAGQSSYASPAARALLGVEFGPLQEAPEGLQFGPPKYDDPALAAFERGQGGDLTRPFIYRYLPLQPRQAGTRKLLTLGRDAALVANAFKGGSAFTLGTVPQRDWSNLAGQAEFVVLLHSLLGAARHQVAESRGFALGEPITFAFPPPCAGHTATLSGPALQSPESRQINPTVATATFPALAQPGNYRLRVDMPEGTQSFGFSLNVDPAESRLERRSADSLEKFFAPGMLHVARDLEGVRRAETLVYRGREITARLVPLLMVALLLELLLANRFYRRVPKEAAPS